MVRSAMCHRPHFMSFQPICVFNNEYAYCSVKRTHGLSILIFSRLVVNFIGKNRQRQLIESSTINSAPSRNVTSIIGFLSNITV